PRFLEHFPDVATELVMPRENGPAASLAAYQLEALRARNRELNGRLAELVAIAGDNEQLMVRVHTLTVGLLRDDNLPDVLKSFVGALNEDFHSELVRVLLFRDGADLPRADWLICVPAGKAALPVFTDFLARGEPACGRLAQDKLDRLFGNDAEDRQRRHARDRERRSQSLPSGHRYAVPEADRAGAGRRDRALRSRMNQAA